MRVLIACEFSGVVRDAFIARGHDAVSCDLLPSLLPGPHYQGDVFDLSNEEWDLVIAHPPCTFLASSGARWLNDYRYPRREIDRDCAADFAMMFFEWADKVCVENPIGSLSTIWRKPDQIISPTDFGHGVRKRTCLWLQGLPKLVPTNIVEPDPFVVFPSGKKMSKWYYDTSCMKHSERGTIRSKTFQGIADAMADQWGNL